LLLFRSYIELGLPRRCRVHQITSVKLYAVMCLRRRQLALVLLATAAAGALALCAAAAAAACGAAPPAAAASAAADGRLSREQAQMWLGPGAREALVAMLGPEGAADLAYRAVLALGGADAACALEWDAAQAAWRRAAYVAGCEGALTCGRPACGAWVPWAPWQWRAPDDPGVRLLPPGEPPPAAAANAGIGGREPVLRAAACPAEERAARGGARLHARWAVPPGKGGWGAATPVAAFHREPRLQACLTEAAGAWLPGPLVRALSAPSTHLEAAPLGGGGGGGGGGGDEDGGGNHVLSLFEFDRSLWPQLIKGLKAAAASEPWLVEKFAVRRAAPRRCRCG
jgi:hypothetical protein